MAMAATSCALVPAFVGGRRRAPSRRRAAAAVVRCSLDTNVSDMAVNGEHRLFRLLSTPLLAILLLQRIT
jgi:hypothetical protein